jgi:hypothetical protein
MALTPDAGANKKDQPMEGNCNTRANGMRAGIKRIPAILRRRNSKRRTRMAHGAGRCTATAQKKKRPALPGVR